ncbi:MAG TPA: hypothetical protein VLM85_01660 [Polyangiaceae bacterium]|nr:hypothetical protein [Polyangiaceae bacterium]
MYAQCDALTKDEAEAEAIVQQLRELPAVPPAPHYDGPLLNRSR